LLAKKQRRQEVENKGPEKTRKPEADRPRGNRERVQNWKKNWKKKSNSKIKGKKIRRRAHCSRPGSQWSFHPKKKKKRRKRKSKKKTTLPGEPEGKKNASFWGRGFPRPVVENPKNFAREKTINKQKGRTWHKLLD